MTDRYYIDKVRDIIDNEFDRDAIIHLRNSLNEVIKDTTPKPEWYMWDVPKTRVYKRDVPGPGVFDSSGFFIKSRPWMCSGVPEDKRETCYESWDDAMEWATMPSKKRIESLRYDAQFEMGQ